MQPKASQLKLPATLPTTALPTTLSSHGRRQFLVGLGSVALTAACSGARVTNSSGSATSGPTTTAPLASTTTTAAGSSGQRTLVVVELAGGNDSLSTVVPHANGRYYDLRPTLAIEDPLDLDGEIGLHPALEELAKMYEQGNMAVVEGVGTAEADLSHFVQMQRWWDGTDQAVRTGWLGRYLDGTVGYDELLAGISIGPGPNPALAGDASFAVNITNAIDIGTGLPWWVEDESGFMDKWSSFAPAGVAAADLSVLERSIQSTVQSQQELAQRLLPLAKEIEEGLVSEDEAETMTGQLRIAAHLIASGLEPKVIVVHGNTDFDTHENQRESHDQMMVDLNGGMVAFNETLATAGMEDQAIVMTTSEFGRRVEDNNGGTDHGAGSSHFLLGANVAGGRYGEPQDLEDLDEDGNLRWSVHHRSLYATVLQDWLGVDPVEVLHDDYPVLPLLT